MKNKFRVDRCADDGSLGPDRRPVSWDVVDQER
jgi:hypothetical protein